MNKSLFSILTLILAMILPAGADAITVGAERPDVYMPLLSGKRVGILTNQTGRVGDKLTVDRLIADGVGLTTIFTPEHGLRGTADAGEKVASSTDRTTGLPVVSLYGSKIKDARLDSIVGTLDVVVVDLQDVGTRFYTYYITMMRLMNSAARQGKEFVVLDRPNPNGMIVDGPVLKKELYSGVGRIPVPVAHGMTLGELARMIVGEKWLEGGRKVRLTVVPCLDYTHDMAYSLPVKPSPNLASDLAVALYPSLCYFEGTPVSVGRGTDNPFTLFGHPKLKGMPDTFTPASREGAKNPPCLGQLCHGRDLSRLDIDSVRRAGVDFSYVIEAYKAMPAAEREKFFKPFFNLLAGNREIARMIKNGASARQIKATWAHELAQFKRQREPYLIYK